MSVQSINKQIQEMENSAYMRGLKAGVYECEYILKLWAENNHRLTPYTDEVLIEYSKYKITALNNLIKSLKPLDTQK